MHGRPPAQNNLVENYKKEIREMIRPQGQTNFVEQGVII